MPSYPNQRTIRIHREAARTDFLGIKNENWQSAARNLDYPAFVLYLYLAANKDDYELALSSAAVKNAVGMARSTYYDQFQKLVNQGYLVNSHGNTYDFYEVPPIGSMEERSVSGAGQENPAEGNAVPSPVQNRPGENGEINIDTATNKEINIEKKSVQEGFKF